MRLRKTVCISLMLLCGTSGMSSACRVVALTSPYSDGPWKKFAASANQQYVFFQGQELDFGGIQVVAREWQLWPGGPWIPTENSGRAWATYSGWGDYTATYRVTTAAGRIYEDSCQVAIFHLQKNLEPWYFNGSSPANYPTQITISAFGRANGHFLWDVQAGGDKVNLLPGADDTVSIDNDNAVQVVSTGASQYMEDVTVSLSYSYGDYGWFTIGNYPLTVHSPTSRTVYWYEPVPWSAPYGYQRTYDIDVWDTLVPSGNMPYPIPINEEFGTFTSSTMYPNESWDETPNNPGMTFDSPNGQWQKSTDTYGVRFQTNPSSVCPLVPGWTEPVQYAPQAYCVGDSSAGEGVNTQSQNVMYCRGTAYQY